MFLQHFPFLCLVWGKNIILLIIKIKVKITRGIVFVSSFIENSAYRNY